jgi:hypothetical protein
MAGNKDGGIKAGVTNKKRHGEDYYSRIGAKGGKKGRTGGFYGNHELAMRAGALGGAISRRTKA